MRKLRKAFIVFAFALLGIVSMNKFYVNANEVPAIQPRINIAEVDLSYDTQVTYDGLYRYSYDYNFQSTTIQYMNGYTRTSSVKSIASILDILSNIERYRTTYKYSTY